jgi:anti-sigma regulatory factor (Ser/Thr protein kinase)
LLLPTTALSWEQECKWTKEQCESFFNDCINYSYSQLNKGTDRHGDLGCACVVEELSNVMSYGNASNEKGNIALQNGIGAKCNSKYQTPLE